MAPVQAQTHPAGVGAAGSQACMHAHARVTHTHTRARARVLMILAAASSAFVWSAPKMAHGSWDALPAAIRWQETPASALQLSSLFLELLPDAKGVGTAACSAESAGCQPQSDAAVSAEMWMAVDAAEAMSATS